MKPSDFLPSFFKYAKRAVIPASGDPEDYEPVGELPWAYEKMYGNTKNAALAENILSPDQKPVVAPVLAPVSPPNIAQPVPEVKPRVTIPYQPPMPDVAMAPVPVGPTSFPGLSENVARGMGHVVTTKSGRVKPIPVELDPNSEEKTIAVNKAYQTYDPEAQPAKGWRKWVPTMISGALRGFAAGGPGGAIFGAAEGGIGGALDPSRANREWQRKKLGETGPIVAGIQKERKAQADLEEQQAETEQRRLAPQIAAAEVTRKRDYDQQRLKIQRDQAVGRLSASQATLKLRELEMKQRAEEGRLNRESREKIAAMRPSPTDATAAEGEALAASTNEAAGALKQELDQQKGQLIENERSISQKEGLWNSQAAQIVAADPSIKLKDAIDQVKAADPDVQSGTYDQTVNNTKALRDAVAEKEKRFTSMQEEIRKSKAKAARKTGSAAPTTHSFSISAYIQRNKGATEADARAFAAKNYPNFEIVQ